MAKATHTVNGKGFEYACLQSLYSHVKAAGKDVDIQNDKPYETAQKSFFTLDAKMQKDMQIAANTAYNLIAPLEPMLTGGPGTLCLSISADAVARGPRGDVRDVICTRGDDWTIGVSCKHNHEGLRHPRITKDKDFGADWIEVPCGDDFMNAITPVTDMLVKNDGTGILWAQIARKHDDYYVPILEAYLDEIQRMCKEGEKASEVPERLLSYFFGVNDFYKIIMKKGITTIEGFNMHGTLNKSCGKAKTKIRVPVLKMPTQLLNADFKPKSKTTIILTFDGGWSISMRLHNKDKRARPTSLAWEVYLEGLPPSTYINTHTWD